MLGRKDRRLVFVSIQSEGATGSRLRGKSRNGAGRASGMKDHRTRERYWFSTNEGFDPFGYFAICAEIKLHAGTTGNICQILLPGSIA